MEPRLRVDHAREEEARELLSRCCGSTRWVERMLARRPFGSPDALLSAAREEWFALSEDDWREAFRQHPRIGDRDGLQRLDATRHLSEREQAGVRDAPAALLDALDAANRAYERKFGHIFIVCATGRSANEMLTMLRERLENAPADEIQVAAREQAKITGLRLATLI